MVVDYRFVIAENLKRFRNWEGLTLEELAQKSELPLDLICGLENATADYGGETLGVLAFYLNRSLDDFFEQERTLRAVRFRAQKSAEPLERAKVVHDCCQWLENYCWLEEAMGDVSVFKLTPATGKEKENIPAYAGQIRRELGIAEHEPIANVADVLEASGAKCWFCKERPSETIFGLSIAESEHMTGIVVFDDESISVERRIFSTIHELAHILLHSSSFDESIWDENQKEEEEADMFASHFLMPDNVFAKRWEENCDKTFVDRVLTVKRFFRVSYETVLMRLAVLKAESPEALFANFRDMFAKQYGRSLTGCAEPAPLLEFDVPPDRFRRMVYQAFRQEDISLRKAAYLLGVPVREFYNDVREIVNQDEIFTL